MTISCSAEGPHTWLLNVQAGMRVEVKGPMSGDDASVLWGWVIVLNLETVRSVQGIFGGIRLFISVTSSQGLLLPFCSLSFSVFL